ncbi:MAG TPA: hypothetical protein VMX17_14895 [Candidatus Glassbacteria bacterium]|nr:hypothetical protein [Candidatus Glassbacteria bacterium]
MNKHEIIKCPNCEQLLRVPPGLGKLKVTCPRCSYTFDWYSKSRIISKITKPIKSLDRIILQDIAIVAGIIILSLIVYKSIVKKETPPVILRHSRPISEEPKHLIKSTKWTSISYSDLLDKNAIIRTGQTLESALGDPNLKGAVQPFVDKYSFLLQYSIEMIYGPDLVPHINVIKHYKIDSKQPAWVGILRGGRISIFADNKNHVRVFLIGYDPRKAYESNYSIIRHCLNGLLPNDGTNLTVEVFAYRNDYGNSEFRVNRKPYIFEASNFPSPVNSVPLDLIGLSDFFERNGQLEGAKLDRKNGLILYAKKSSNQTIAGHNISLADFAVAYRAIFHAGDNKAFISLDPHKDPTKVTVNFGGFLEDTRIGAVVLESDKRFKTITSGLDPNSFRDLRRPTRQFIPSFMTSCERNLVSKHFTETDKWIGTRFWFYPDSVEIESDFTYEYAKITKSEFKADAERSKNDFLSLEEFEKKKKATLSPGIWENIEHLNNNYLKYARVYPEIEELTCVARLMGICSWLQRANPTWLDLDALLSVELPPFQTDREKTQLLAISHVAYLQSEGMDEDYVKNNSKAIYLSWILNKTVKEYFLNFSNIAKYLCYKNNIEEDNYDIYKSESKGLMSTYNNKKVEEMIKTEKDLKALVVYASRKIEFTAPLAVKKYGDEIESDKRKLERIERKINTIKSKMYNASPVVYNSYVVEHNQLVEQCEIIGAKLNRKIAIYNQSLIDVRSLCIMGISGGINLEPEYFNIKKTSKSIKLEKFKNIANKTELDWRLINGSESWIQSRTKTGGTTYKNSLPKNNWISKLVSKSDGTTYEYIKTDKQQDYWISSNIEKISWRDLLKLEDSSYRERMFDSSQNNLHIAEFESGKLKDYIIGNKVSDDKITFSRPSKRNLLKPEEPPVWWVNK